jgi:hypothetical protein
LRGEIFHHRLKGVDEQRGDHAGGHVGAGDGDPKDGRQQKQHHRQAGEAAGKNFIQRAIPVEPRLLAGFGDNPIGDAGAS